ncbi:MAG: hypothetical protein JWR21_4441 [Herminiimonas sp.]|nr:hypothetical protein [Herminiimonas sp.]
MTHAEILHKAKTVAAELEALRVEIGLDKPRRTLLKHTLTAKENIDAMMQDLEHDQAASISTGQAMH